MLYVFHALINTITEEILKFCTFGQYKIKLGMINKCEVGRNIKSMIQMIPLYFWILV